MTNAPEGMGRDRLAQVLRRLFDEERRLAGRRPGVAMSQREFQRRTGMPRQTIQDFLRDPSRSRAGTVARILAAVESRPVRETRRGVTTVSVDAPTFTPGVLGDLVQPEGVRAFRYVYEAEGYTSTGYATTDYVVGDSPGDAAALLLVPGGADAVRRVIWDAS